MNCLVTGGAGFIGSHLCETLLARGDSVVCVDDFNDYYNPRIKEQNIKNILPHGNFKLYRADILNAKAMAKVFKENKIDKIIHLAARVGDRQSTHQPGVYSSVNIMGTLNLLELAKKHNVQNFVYGSTASVYGGHEKKRVTEEDSIERPVSQYAVSKKSSELLCHAYHHLHGLNVSCLRIFTVYGPRGRPDMAPYKFMRSIIEGRAITRFGDGKTKRDYTYVADVVQGIISALDKDFPFEIFNLGNSKAVELNKFIGIMEEVTDKTAKINELPHQLGDVLSSCADITKAQELLGYNPETNIEEGIKKFYDWYTELKKSSNQYSKYY